MTFNRRAAILFVLALLFCLVVACGAGSQFQPEPTPNIDRVYETAQTRINEMQTEVSK